MFRFEGFIKCSNFLNISIPHGGSYTVRKRVLSRTSKQDSVDYKKFANVLKVPKNE